MFGKNKSTGSIEYIVVGLGNPDRKYENTRHNAGWLAIDRIADKLGCDVNKIKYKSFIGTCTVNGAKVMLMKPTTYMNNSGQAVVEAMNFYKIPPENVIVIFDDISLDVGKMRIRSKGSDGGQRECAVSSISAEAINSPHQGWHRRKAKSRLGPCRLGAFKVHFR